MVTLLLLPPLPPVADLDGADTDDDGHYEEEDPADEPGGDGAPLHILRHGVPGHNNHQLIVELAMKLREDFTITEKARTRRT